MSEPELSALESALWVSGPDFDYGSDDAGYYEDHHNQIVAGRFEVADARGVALEIASLGYRVVYLNGRRVSDDVLAGEWTRFDKLVYCDCYDVSDLLVPGENTIEVELGNGWYNPSPLTLFGKYDLRERLAEVGTPQVLVAVVDGAGNAIARSDESWTWREGQLAFNSVYLGERRDLGFLGMARSGVVARPNTRTLAPAVVERCRRSDVVEPREVRELDGGILVDMGEMVAGFAELAFSAHAGQRVTVTYAEVVDDEGRPSYSSNLAGMVGLDTPRGRCPGGPGAPALALEQDVIVAKEGENAFANEFCWHSFRYAFVKGLERGDLLGFSARYVHSNLAQAGDLVTDNPFYEKLVDAARRTKLNNVHGLWEDCARERLGYGGDMIALFSSNAFLFDVRGLLDKTLADFRRDQTERGGLPETAPFMGIGSNGPAYGEGPLLWQLAYPYLTVRADQWYGRRDLLEREWPGLRRFADYLLSFDPEELSRHCLGDHGSVESSGFGGTPDKELCGWCAILWALGCIDEVAVRLGEDADDLAHAIETLTQEIVARFRNDDGSFGGGTQTSYAFAAALGLGDARDLTARLASLIREHDYVISCGIFGTMLAFDQLNRYGYDDVVEGWLLREGDPSFRDMLASGSGALAEEFHAFLSSYDHAMFSSYVQWLWQGLGGIRVADDAVAADHLVIRPFLSHENDSVACSYETPRGQASVSWERRDGVVTLTLTLPAGTRAELCLGDDVTILPAGDGPSTRTCLVKE
jgi:alpha-L-rhamnosidase